MKKISFLLVFLILLQSCNVYNLPTNVEEAVAAESKVKVVSADGQKYRFRRLVIENNRLLGVTKKGTSTAEKLDGRPTQIDEKYLKVDLTGLEFEKISLHNKKASTNLSIIAVAASILVTAVAVFIISFATAEWNFGEGPQ